MTKHNSTTLDPDTIANQEDSLLLALLSICKILHSPHSAESLTSGLPLVDHKLTPALFIRAAERAGFSTGLVTRPLEKISNLVLPAVLLLKNNKTCILVSKNENQYTIILPETDNGEKTVSLEELNDHKAAAPALAELFASFEECHLLALDNVDLWLNFDEALKESKEILLFNLFNHFKINNQQLLLSAETSPSQLNCLLPDLLSRIKSGLLLNLSMFSDSEKEKLLQDVAQQKGFSLDEGVSAFIIKRSGRHLNDLMSVLNRLDQASLTEKRKLTIPFAKKVLNW